MHQAIHEGRRPLSAATPLAVGKVRGPDSAARGAWRRAYVGQLVFGDVVAAGVASAAGFAIRFGPVGPDGGPLPATIWIAVLFPAVWLAVMVTARVYETRFLFLGPEEFRRVVSATVAMLALVGTVSWALKLEVARGLVIATLPLACLLTLGFRYVRRKALHRRRQGGTFLQTALIVGHRNGVAALHAQIRREGYHGYRVVGCCVPQSSWSEADDHFDGLPVLGTMTDVADVVRRHEVDMVAVLPSPELEGSALRRLGWELEESSTELFLAPAVTDIAGPRVNIRPVCGLPLLQMERPELRGVRRLVKNSVDRVGAGLGLLIMLPVLLGIALAIRVTDAGPVFFRQERVGRDGKSFVMLKFRSMVNGADRMAGTLSADNDGNGVLFKLRNDPRVTGVGRILRRYSLDELPQLINVLRGEMSLVGPRPPLQSEVDSYGIDMRRRLVVKPGLTGLWQVSGRSNLSWDDSVRMDVQYVENWSLTFDFMILWKTVRTVVRGEGAY